MAEKKKTTTVSRKDVKQAEQLRISQVGDFKKRLGGVMELPSGLVVEARNPGGLQAFIGTGIIPNSLMSIINDAIKRGKTPDTDAFMKDGEFDPDMMADLMQLIDGIAIKVVVQPSLEPKPDSEDQRLDTQLYVDELPFDDKMFLFQWVSGGTRDLEKFRQQFEQNLVSVAAKSSNVRAAQRAAGLDPR